MSKKIKDFYFLLVVLYSGLSLTFFRNNEGLIILFLIGLFIFGKSLFRPSRSLVYALGIWFLYFAINTIIVKSFHPFFFGTYIAKIVIAWWLLSNYREKIFLNFENIIYNLALISLGFYAWQLVNPESLYSILQHIDLSQNLFPDRKYESLGFFTFHQLGIDEKFPRNAGFTWEPGPFASYLVLAMFFNLARNEVKINDKKRLGIFLLTLITTQSTTGMLALLGVVIWFAWSRNTNASYRIISIPLAFVIITILFTSLPYLQAKIINESQQDIELLIDNSIKYGSSYNPGRFASFQLGWKDFKTYPIAGIGGQSDLRYATQQGADISTTNGLAQIMTKYGSIGLILFLFLIVKSGKWISQYFLVSGSLIFPGLLLIISFSFSIIETPLVVIFWLIPLFLKKKINLNRYNESHLLN